MPDSHNTKRSTEPIYPNIILGNKAINEHAFMHKKKIASVKSCIDNKAPQRYKHLQYRLKKKQMHADNDQKIQHENLILVDKLKTILLNRQVDMYNDIEPRSMNRVFRTRELTKIVADNKNILHRISTSKPTFSTPQWEREHDEHIRRLRSMGRFPYVDRSAPESVQMDMLLAPGLGSARSGLSAANSIFSSRPTSSQGISSRPISRPQTGSRSSDQKGFRSFTPVLDRPLSAPGSGIGGTHTPEQLERLFGYPKNKQQSPTHKHSKVEFNQSLQISGKFTYLQVIEISDPASLELKAYVPATELQYVLSLPFDQLSQCFPPKLAEELLRPSARRTLLQRLLRSLKFVLAADGVTEHLELAIEINEPPGLQDNFVSDDDNFGSPRLDLNAEVEESLNISDCSDLKSTTPAVPAPVPSRSRSLVKTSSTKRKSPARPSSKQGMFVPGMNASQPQSLALTKTSQQAEKDNERRIAQQRLWAVQKRHVKAPKDEPITRPRSVKLPSSFVPSESKDAQKDNQDKDVKDALAPAQLQRVPSKRAERLTPVSSKSSKSDVKSTIQGYQIT
jgi:hypothetical protein